MQSMNGGAYSPPTTGGRMALRNISSGIQKRPEKLIVYGEPGCGKSTLAASMKKPIFICTEDGTSQLNVDRFPHIAAWDEIEQCIYTLEQESHSYQTCVIDTIDHGEALLHAAIAKQAGKQTIADIPYGGGTVLAGERMRRLCNRLDMLIRIKRMRVVILAHAHVTKVEDIHAGTFERVGLKLHKRAVEPLTEWADAVLYARHEIVVTERKGRGRAVMSGARILLTQNSGAYFAKNRFGLPAELPLDAEELDRALEAGGPDTPEALRAQIEKQLGLLAPDQQEGARKALDTWAGDDPIKLARLLNKVSGKVLIASQGAPAGETTDAAQGDEGGAS